MTIRVLTDIYVQDEHLVAKMGSHNAVLPTWQGRGIAWMWDDYSDAHQTGHVWDVNLSFEAQHPASRHKSLKRGRIEIANPVVLLYRAFDGQPFATAKHSRLRRLAAAAHLHLRWRAKRGAPAAPVPGLRIGRIERFDERADALAGDARTQFDFTYGRSASYLNWRHMDPRGGPSVVLAAELDDELLGYVVVRIEKDSAHLADLLIHSRCPDAGAPLVAAAIDAAREFDSRGIRAWQPPEHPYRAALVPHGLLETGFDAHFHYPPNDTPCATGSPTALRARMPSAPTRGFVDPARAGATKPPPPPNSSWRRPSSAVATSTLPAPLRPRPRTPAQQLDLQAPGLVN